MDTEIVKFNFLTTVHNYKNTSQKTNISSFKLLKKTLPENNLITVKADKGNRTALLHEDTYQEKVCDFLNNNSFKHIPSDPTNKLNKIL